MLKLLLSKELFEDILNNKTKQIEKDATKHWKKELFEVSIVNDEVVYNIKKVAKIELANEFGEDKPNIVVECYSIEYNKQKNIFIFTLGKVIENRNITQNEDYKDILIAQLLREKKALQEGLKKDSATQLYNKEKFEEDLLEFVKKANIENLAVIQAVFKNYNYILQEYGEDFAIISLKNVINRVRRYIDVLNLELYRYSSNSFLMLLNLPKNRVESIVEILEKDLKNMSILHQNGEVELFVEFHSQFWNEFLNIVKFKNNLHQI